MERNRIQIACALDRVMIAGINDNAIDGAGKPADHRSQRSMRVELLQQLVASRTPPPTAAVSDDTTIARRSYRPQSRSLSFGLRVIKTSGTIGHPRRLRTERVNRSTQRVWIGATASDVVPLGRRSSSVHVELRRLAPTPGQSGQ